MQEIKHGMTRRNKDGTRTYPPEWRIYNAMKTRCLNENSPRFSDYGGRGITICDRWLHGENGKTGVECFVEDMGPRPSPSHSLDRVENDLGYSPGNCRWATRKEQARNSRASKIVEFRGETVTLAEAVERFSAVRYGTVLARLRRGWGVERALTEPLEGKA